MLVLCRHGRTIANAAGRLQGRLDQPLDAEGVRQAQAVAEAIGTPDLLVSSPLLRACQTADAYGIEYTIDDRWIELDYGQWEGWPLQDVPAETWATWRGDNEFAAPDGETLTMLDRRVRQACDELVDTARDATVVVVSHVSPIKAAVAWALDHDVRMSWRCRLDQAAVCRIEMTASGPSLVTFNQVYWS